MNELVLVKKRNDQVVTSSLVVAEKFEKQHKHVMESIKNLMVENSAVRKFFEEGTYTNSRGREYPLYYMNRDGFSLLAMGFTGKKALEFKLKFVEQFNKLEQMVIQSVPSYQISDPIERAKRWIDEEKHRQLLEGEVLQLNHKIEEYEPKVRYLDEILNSKDTMTVTQIAKDYGLSARRLNQILHEQGVQYKTGKQWVLYAKHAGKGYTQSKTHSYDKSNGFIGVNVQTVWTQKGRLLIHNTLESLGIVAEMDKDESM